MSKHTYDEKIEKIRKYILKSGFPSEIEIGNILRKMGWIVINQAPYIDKTTNKVRTIDVSAFKPGPTPAMSGFRIIAECKKSEQHYWVFHTQPKLKEFLPALITVVELFKTIGHPAILDKVQKLSSSYTLEKLFGFRPSSSEQMNKLSKLHFLDEKIKIGVLHVIPDSKDDFFEATQQIASAIKNAPKYISRLLYFL